MNGSDNAPRRYPPFWEKFIPIFLAVITLTILGLIVFALIVILG